MHVIVKGASLCEVPAYVPVKEVWLLLNLKQSNFILFLSLILEVDFAQFHA